LIGPLDEEALLDEALASCTASVMANNRSLYGKRLRVSKNPKMDFSEECTLGFGSFDTP